jgi:flagellar biosynthesis/type III secretory pathway ATPase
VRGILDGHVVLSRKLAQQNHYPAIDILASLSRLMSDLAPPDHRAAAGALRQLLAAYQQSEDLISIGAYQKGSNPTVDAAIALRPMIQQFLQQATMDRSNWLETQSALLKLVKMKETLSAARPGSP